MSEIQAKGISGRLTLAARDGTVQLLEHSEWYTWRADDVAAVAAEALRQREEIERRKRTRIVTCPLSGGEYASIEWVAGGDVKVRHGGCHSEWSTFAADAIAAYRELVEANKHE